MKLLASDLDGTLYFGESAEKLKPQDVQAIKQFQADGNLFGICSGRTYAGIHHALDGLAVHLDFYLLSSGSCLADADGNYIYYYALSKDLICRIIHFIQNEDVSILFCHNEDYYRVSSEDSKSDYGILIHDPHDAPYETYDSLHLRFQNKESLLHVKEMLEKQFSSEIEAHHNVLNLDITPAGHSKGQAIATLNQYLPVQFEDIAAIGDSFNDISMLEAAKTSFTFHRSEEAVKKSAKYIVDDIAEAIAILQGG